jgi:hypothetical protein
MKSSTKVLNRSLRCRTCTERTFAVTERATEPLTVLWLASVMLSMPPRLPRRYRCRTTTVTREDTLRDANYLY